jgi:4-amino-4-deoxy-L-arabinose transferase-like glycosyltransferase
LVLLTLLRQPAIIAAQGLYAREGQAQPYNWTSSLATFPVRSGSGPTRVALSLTAGRWPERTLPQVALATDTAELAAFPAPDRARTYHLLLPPSAASLSLRATVAQPPGDPRWLGVQILDITAETSGWPLRPIVLALLAALLSIPLALAGAWCVRRGYGWVAAISVLGLLLRVVRLDRVPAGFFQDEAISLVDALHLARTGHDHLGHFLPLGALEAFGDWISPLFTYLAVPAVALFGPELLAGRLLAALAGALAIPAGYGLARALRLPIAATLLVALVFAISPWQILRTRAATAPALVPLCWTLCLWAAVVFVRRADRRAALWLALAAGLGIYAYPTMKLAVPLLLALALLLALLHHGWQAVRGWLPAAALLALLWLPLVAVTLLNPDSAMRAQSKLLRADTPIDWVAQWAQGYAGYFLPGFYYQTGDPSNGMPDQGVQLPVEAPLVLLGLGLLLWRCTIADFRFQISDCRLAARQSTTYNLRSAMEWWLIAGALLIAPLPASLMFPNPHLTRALLVAPGYALLVGMGAVLLGHAVGRLRALPANPAIQYALVALLATVLLGQGGLRFADYLERFPAVIASKYQDGMFEAMRAAVQLAPQYDEVWIDDRMTFPYIFVLAAQPMPPADAQAQIAVRHGRTTFNTVTGLGKYRFTNLAAPPGDLPVVAALPTGLGQPGFVLQEWRDGQRRVLLVRRMRAA